VGDSDSKQDYLKEGAASINYSCAEFKKRSGDFGSSVEKTRFARVCSVRRSTDQADAAKIR
jgi:hypothetical protein